MNSNYLNIMYTLIYSVPATLVAIVLHEVAHAAMSYACGDKMVKADGRLSLNPLKHLDLMGTLCLILFHMGWAKPVVVNTRSYKHKKLDFCLVALAGPVMNFLVAFISIVFMYVVLRFLPQGVVSTYLYYLFYYIALLDIGLGVFNLIPIPPLDGSNVLFSFLPDSIAMKIRPYRQYFPLILAIFLISGVLNTPLSWLDYKIFNGMGNLVLKMFGYTYSVGGTGTI